MTTPGDAEIMVVDEVLEEINMGTLGISLVEVRVHLGEVSVISEGEGEVTEQANKGRQFLHQTLNNKFWCQLFDLVSAQHLKRIRRKCSDVEIMRHFINFRIFFFLLGLDLEPLFSPIG